MADTAAVFDILNQLFPEYVDCDVTKPFQLQLLWLQQQWCLLKFIGAEALLRSADTSAPLTFRLAAYAPTGLSGPHAAN